jgi:uncharacterized protein (DUF2062 family)
MNLPDWRRLWRDRGTLAREGWARLRGGQLSPVRCALSVAVGLAIGVTPLFGVHLILVLAVCLPLRLDAAVSYLAANISIPPIAPFLLFAELQIGAWLRTGALLPLTRKAMTEHSASEFAREVALGTTVFAPAIALAGGALAYCFVRLLQGAGGKVKSDAAPSGEPKATSASNTALK